MTEEEKLKSGLLFFPDDPELAAQKYRAHNLNIDFNGLHQDCEEERNAILSELVGEIGEGSFFQGPITFHYGRHTKIGSGCFFNFNFTVQDDAEVTIGDGCSFGPNVTIVTPIHPMLADERRPHLCPDGQYRAVCYAKPVTIGHDCWFGANVVVCPGVTVGDGCVIGAGSVIIDDIPSGVFAAGNPCRVIRPITESDSIKNRPEILGDYRELFP